MCCYEQIAERSAVDRNVCRVSFCILNCYRPWYIEMLLVNDDIELEMGTSLEKVNCRPVEPGVLKSKVSTPVNKTRDIWSYRVQLSILQFGINYRW